MRLIYISLLSFIFYMPSAVAMRIETVTHQENEYRIILSGILLNGDKVSCTHYFAGPRMGTLEYKLISPSGSPRKLPQGCGTQIYDMLLGAKRLHDNRSRKLFRRHTL